MLTLKLYCKIYYQNICLVEILHAEHKTYKVGKIHDSLLLSMISIKENDWVKNYSISIRIYTKFAFQCDLCKNDYIFPKFRTQLFHKRLNDSNLNYYCLLNILFYFKSSNFRYPFEKIYQNYHTQPHSNKIIVIISIHKN